MKVYKDLKREDIPCWYELSWQEKPPAIILRVHKDFIANAPVIPDDAPIIKQFMEGGFGFKKFCANLEGNFGFDNAFQPGKETEEFVEFVAVIPRIEKQTGKPCPSCKGSGKNEFFPEDKCLHCEGEGKEWKIYWCPAYAISATFTIFFLLSRFPEKETSSSLLQLLTVCTATLKEMHGGSLDGEFSRPLCQWLRSLVASGETNLPVITRAMVMAYGRMFRLKDFYRFSFRADIRGEKGGLCTDCPGDATGIHPSDWYFHEEEGYEFSSHNVDTPMQQITLLAGLAALHDLARKEGVGVPKK